MRQVSVNTRRRSWRRGRGRAEPVEIEPFCGVPHSLDVAEAGTGPGVRSGAAMERFSSLLATIDDDVQRCDKAAKRTWITAAQLVDIAEVTIIRSEFRQALDGLLRSLSPPRRRGRTGRRASRPKSAYLGGYSAR